ncbi:hypothetical protein [Streptococcus pneumoniae]|nr:hypothetical protein [Streptococcus pneumoniae]
MKIKEQTRKLAHRFEVADRTDEVSSKYCFEVAIELTKSHRLLKTPF